MERTPDKLLAVGLIGIALLLLGALLGDRAAPLAPTGLIGTLLAAGAALWRAMAGRWHRLTRTTIPPLVAVGHRRRGEPRVKRGGRR